MRVWACHYVCPCQYVYAAVCDIGVRIGVRAPGSTLWTPSDDLLLCTIHCCSQLSTPINLDAVGLAGIVDIPRRGLPPLSITLNVGASPLGTVTA